MKLKLVLALATFMNYNLKAQQKGAKKISDLYYNSEKSALDLPWLWLSFSIIAIFILVIIGRKYNHKEY
jgi:Na+/H+ antiporter NhaC